MAPKNNKGLGHWKDDQLPPGLADKANDKALANWYAHNEMPLFMPGEEESGGGGGSGLNSLACLLGGSIIQ